MTRKELAKSAYVSERFLAQLETGHGNISIIRLRRIAHAMDLGVERLAQERNGDMPEIAGTIALLEKLKPEERRRAQAMLLEKFGVKSEEERRGRVAGFNGKSDNARFPGLTPRPEIATAVRARGPAHRRHCSCRKPPREPPRTMLRSDCTS